MKNKVIMISIIVLAILAVILLWQVISFKPSHNKSNAKDSEIDNSIFHEYYPQAEKLVNKMTLEEKVGQLFLVRYDSSKVDAYVPIYPGGYILFAKDFEVHTKESLKAELETNQLKNPYKLIVGVDEEGGFVTRMSRYPNYRTEKYQAPKYYYELGGYELLKQVETDKAQLLLDLGINLNLAPVADISMNEEDYMFNRSFGKDAKETSEFIKNMVTYANDAGINSCLKHFPGYGNNPNTHTGIAIDNRSYEEFKENDYLPFQAGIEAKVPSILVSHNIMTCLDDQYPASLSKKVIKDLRIVMTDDLEMDAVKAYVENQEAATLAINAGNDMIITSDFEEMYLEVLNSVKSGKIKEETLNKAVLRIIAWKYYSHLL